MQCFFGVRRRARGAGQGLAPLNVFENLRNQRRILNARDDPEFAAAFGASLDVDGEDPFETLHPAHGGGECPGSRPGGPSPID
jgi:hypothetical protein